MPPTRLDAPPAAEEPRPAEAAAAAAPKAAAGFAAWLPLAATLTVMPLVAFGLTKFVLVPELRKSVGAAPAAAAESRGKETVANPEAKRESVPMSKLLVNVAGTMGARYLLVSLSVTGSDPDLKAKIQAHDPQLRDMACGALATKTLADLEKPGARNLIRSELLSGFNNILGGPLVQEIFLTEFAIQ